ncbi:unnamed protein product [Symbiodinium pilosum]|uniref:Uncharacterized protein n=1 Tax=Symbiodinium pilosum TaxID=2952 RepID=A0A812RRW7_SYMPI|nr:unnamed protein product [Symbiodinium pilosum]
MQDVLWEVVPEAGVVASAGVVGGSLLKLLDTFGAAAAGVSGVAVGAVSATVGALAAKTFTDRHDRLAVEKRLMDVKRHAPQSSPLSLQPLLAIRQMLEAMDWCLAHEEEHWSRHGAASLAMNCFSGGRGLDNIPKDCKPDKDYRRHLKKIRSLCSPSPLRGQGGRVKNTKTEKRGKTTRDAGVISGLSVPGSSEAYERLFNPQWGTVRSKQGVCAALAYLVTQFMELRHCPTGSLLDGDRRSLRLAVAALARHHVFDEDEKASHALKFTRLLHPTLANAEQDEIDDEEHKRWKNNPDQEQEFRSAALALICLLDAALAWRPSDPLGWMGQAEDAEGAVLAREKGVCSFATFACKVRRCLKKASGGCPITWRRLDVHLDAVRTRALPEPWPWIWVLNEEASMLVRNRTKVPLRVELHRPKAAQAFPLADLPLMKPILQWFHGKVRPVLTADVKPGIEWALRPESAEGREFKVKLLTTAGVLVCTKPLRRGQSFDFHVPVPPPPAQLRAAALACQRESFIEAGTVKGRLKATDEAAKAFGRREHDDDGSVCSTAAPSFSSGRLSLASTASASSAGALGAKTRGKTEMQAKLEDRRRKIEGLPTVLSSAEDDTLDAAPQQEGNSDRAAGEQEPGTLAQPVAGLLSAVEGFRTCLCPRCLHAMPLRRHRPRAAIYVGGVSCDRCKRELLGQAEAEEVELEPQDAFCHCNRCWFDLCRRCAYKEMQDVWWGEE